MAAALKTYLPSGRHDDHLLFASSGHAGQVLVIGVPSMRILKEIAVFTPEPWQGWGYGSVESRTVLNEGRVNGKDVLWGDTHHPALSQTNAEYDGQFLFINDKANAPACGRACADPGRRSTRRPGHRVAPRGQGRLRADLCRLPWRRCQRASQPGQDPASACYSVGPWRVSGSRGRMVAIEGRKSEAWD
ncbi:MAG: hypothetical protein ACYCW6_26825 [Candidatus Xenobia bacterium]